MKIRFFYRSLNMQTRELDHATIAVANTTNISGTATADKIKHGLRSEKKRSQWCISGLPGLGSLMATGIFVALTLLPARAGQGGVPAEIAALQAQVTALQSQVKTLQTANTDQQNEINSLKASDATLQKRLAAVQSNHALLLGPFVNVDPNPEIGVIGPNIVFSGANIHIVSGSGVTNDNFNFKGLGNLIIGYDEDPSTAENAGGIPPIVPLPPLEAGDRGGSHNLVIGRWNRFPSAFGGFVAGEANTIVGAGTSVSGGAANTAGNLDASVSGGRFNTAGSPYSSVSGGQSNIATLSTGHFGFGASVSGGTGNTASGTNASVCGGEGNTAFNDSSTVTGGTGNTAGSDITFQGGLGATVVGGSGNTAGGHYTVVIGGQNIIDYVDFTIQPKAPFP